MKILIASQYKSLNTYVKDIVDELKNKVEIVTESQNFWTSSIHFDIIHIQWAEELFQWRMITDKDLDVLDQRINYFKKNNIKIISTLHNRLPHRKNRLDEKLYELVYSNSDCIINLGHYSSNLFPKEFNEIIFHPNYSKHFNVVEQKSYEPIFFSFGKIRIEQEEQQIIDGFISANIPNSKLIISNSIVGINPYSRKKDILKNIYYRFKLRNLEKKGIQFITKSLNNEDIENYFNRSAVIISPRIDNLNSGVLFMGFTFGKVVIGPSIGNLTEFLKVNDNPMFIPNNIQSIAKAMKTAIKMKNIGLKNKRFSEEFLDPKKIAQQHINLYKKLLK